MVTWDYDPGDGDGAYFKSISVGGTKWSRQGDAMWGEAYIQQSSYPTAWLAYAEWGIYNDSNQIDVNGAKGYVANTYLAMEENAPNGTLVRRQSLKEGWGSTGIQWDTANSGVSGELKYVSFNGGIKGQSWVIALTFVVSDVVGVIDLADATVTPKSLESIVSISNWPYQDVENTLTLVMAVATGEAHVKGKIVTSGSDASKVYFSLASQATVQGSKQDVTVSAFSSGEFSSTIDSNCEAQLKAVYGSKSQVQLVHVTFPAGAADILYDPTLGAGEVAADNASSSNAANVAMVVLVACLAMLLL